MKHLLSFAFALITILALATSASAQEKTVRFWTGGSGTFEYVQNEGGQEFVVWVTTDSGKTQRAVVDGEILMSLTKITVKNLSCINKSNLHILSGKQVSVLALISEGGDDRNDFRRICVELEIVVGKAKR
jgi:hypothetical protein